MAPPGPQCAGSTRPVAGRAQLRRPQCTDGRGRRRAALRRCSARRRGRRFGRVTCARGALQVQRHARCRAARHGAIRRRAVRAVADRCLGRSPVHLRLVVRSALQRAVEHSGGELRLRGARLQRSELYRYGGHLFGEPLQLYRLQRPVLEQCVHQDAKRAAAGAREDRRPGGLDAVRQRRRRLRGSGGVHPAGARRRVRPGGQQSPLVPPLLSRRPVRQRGAVHDPLREQQRRAHQGRGLHPGERRRRRERL